MNFFDWIAGRQPFDLDAVRASWARERNEHVRSAVQGPYGNNADLYEQTADLFAAAKFPEPESFAKRTVSTFLEQCEAHRLPEPHFDVGVQFVCFAAAAYTAERLNDLPPNPARHFVHNSHVVVGQMRDLLLRQQRKAIDPKATLDALTAALTGVFVAITRHLPALAHGNPDGDLRADQANSVPLIDLLPNVGRVVEDALAALDSPEAKAVGLFRYIRQHLEENAAKIAERSRSKFVPRPSEYDGTPREIVEAYLKDALLDGIFLDSRVPLEISLEDRGEHTAIIAGSGWGKTQLLQSIIADDLERDEPPALIVIDSTGAMVQRIQRLAVFNEHLKDRLVIIDPEQDPVPALNPFDVSNPRFSTYDEGVRERMQGEVIDLFNYVFSTVKNPLTTRMETAFAFMVRLLLSIPGANIHTLLDLLNDEPAKGEYAQAVFKPHIDKLDPTTQLFFKAQYYTGRDGGLREQIRARVFDILRVPAFERMFSTVNKVDFFTELNRGSIVLVNTSENLLKDGSATFGRYIIARVMAAAFERAPIPPEKRRQAFIIVDEAAPYFDETFEKLLNRVRQFKLGVVIAFQNLEQASEKLRSTIASSTAVKYAGGTGYTDARWLSREMRVDAEFILAQKRDGRRPPQWSQFACYVRNFTDRAVSLTVPFYSLENMPKMSDVEHAALVERNRARVAAPASVPERMSPAPPPKPEPAPADPTAAALAKAYADLSEAIGQSHWERAAELKNGIIPELERKSRSPDPRQAATRPDVSRHAATSRDEPLEGTTDWR